MPIKHVLKPNDVFGRLTVLKEVERRGHHRQWQCQCECGTIKVIGQDNLIAGKTRSCGCLALEVSAAKIKEFAQVTHGLSRTPIYIVHQHVMNRCYDPKNPIYKDYGGRGITVYKPWHDVAKFAKDLGQPPFEGAELDRIDNNQGYYPENVRWTTRKIQMRNQRRTIQVTYKGETRPLREWAEILKIPFLALYQRIYKLNWDTDRALSTPLGPNAVKRK